MKINFNEVDTEQFKLKNCVFCSIESILITPNGFSPKWDSGNKKLRSSIWAKDDGRLLSASFSKFVNIGENPLNFPPPTDLHNTEVVMKIDGSCLIADYENGLFSMRSRGTSSYLDLENFKDFDYVSEKYRIWQACEDFYGFSLLFEIVTPNQRIVLDYGNEPDIFLIGIVDKEDYYLTRQPVLDYIAETYGFKRPQYFKFENLSDLVAYIKDAKDLEGVCIYTNKGQEIHKLKSEFYLAAHRLKSAFCSITRVVEFYAQCGLVSSEEFLKRVNASIDYEVRQRATDDIERVSRTIDDIQATVVRVRDFIENFKDLSRKDFSEKARKEFGQDVSLVFTLLDNKEVKPMLIEQIVNRYLEKSSGN